MFISIPFNAVAMGSITGEFNVLGGVYETENYNLFQRVI